MKPSIEEVFRFVTEYMCEHLERPSMYASSPEALEDVLWVLDRVRLYIANGPERSESQYQAYLGQNGFGARSFTGRYRKLPIDKRFESLIKFWRQYLAQTTPPLGEGEPEPLGIDTEARP